MKLPVAVQLYSVRDEMQNDFYGTIKKMKEIGYDGFLTIERECGENPALDIAKATSFLREKTC